ncbi:nuclear transport factor 2 family protein [Actinokineospora bangkokensis]|uniref:SnoaL-like domain-containing protein n=1 Tax=Actinokineospora bangkokensis TaxID=1193682 RepID=A0A1Q9LIM8_9PSEU|nr:nuclear transport factor 2 family protein [Actinokineospora bangkokensis]OLR91873.1 hypothetical protein BJP25_23860 [Actinokineospora bangkokensis]
MLTAATRADITDLLVEFAWRIDHDEGRGVEDLFTEDGEYLLFGHPVRGRDNIRSLYDHRRSRGTRTSRHLFDNIRVTPGPSEREARATSVLTLHAADGRPPLPLAPLLVADYTDALHRDDDGQWRFHRRTTTLLFQPT